MVCNIKYITMMFVIYNRNFDIFQEPLFGKIVKIIFFNCRKIPFDENNLLDNNGHIVTIFL